MATDTVQLPAGGSFLSTPPPRIFTVEDFGPDDRLMIDTAEQFVRKEIMAPDVLVRLERQEEGLMPRLIYDAGQLGLVGIDTPEAYGGLGLPKNLAARILEFLSLNGSFSVTVGVTSGIAQVGLSMFGTHEQKSAYLPRLASGEWIGAYCLSEPNSGSDALSATTRAERRGGLWVLNGTKMWISNAKWARFFLVMAKIDGEHFSAFLVERDFPGMIVAREEHKMGLKGSSTARVVLENCEVPLENLLYEPGKGHHVAFNALNIGRFKLASMSMGPARDAIGLAVRYAQDRRQFGQPIAQFGLIRKKLVEMAARFFVAESAIYRTGHLIDGAFDLWGGDVAGNRRAAEEYAIECSAVKILSTEVESFIVDEALQVYGGYGFTEEFPIAQHYRDARVSRIYEGTNEINRVFLASRLLKKIDDGALPPESAGDSFVSELVARGVAARPAGQIEVGALSDLVTLAYAEQSARLRASRVGGPTEALYAAALPWINLQAAAAYQTLTGESVSLPAAPRTDWDGLADLVLHRQAPL
ncbi:MAG: acyl-CoA dehydrogenase family protein [Fimbriimonadaceae bacterium]